MASDPISMLRFAAAANKQDTQVKILFLREGQTVNQLDQHHRGALTFHGPMPTMLSVSDFIFM